MPFKSWILRRETEKGFIHALLTSVRHLKKNPHGSAAGFSNVLRYLFGFFRWRFSLALIQPLNTLREMQFMLSVRKQLYHAVPSLRKHCVEVSKPVNLKPHDNRIFASNFYLLKPLQVLHFKDYYLYSTSFFGIVFHNFHIVPESIHGKWAKRRKVVFKDYYRMVMDGWLDAESERNILQLEEDKHYLHVHHWFNYYHWLTETLARIWVVRERLDDYTLLLPEGLQRFDFVQQSLQIFGVKNIHWLKEGIPVQVKNLTLVQNKPYCNHYDPIQVKEMGQFFRNYVAAHPQKHEDFGDKIFITRKKAGRRMLVNENEIEAMLREAGFKMVALEDYTILQEISIMSKVKYLIGMHGAGLTNMLFMPVGGKVLELHRVIKTSAEMHSDVYWKLAGPLNHTYFYQFCEAANPSQNFFEADLLVDKTLFEENLMKFLHAPV